MLSKLRSILTSLLIVLMVLQGSSPLLSAQVAAPTPEQLDQLLAPVALYPDALLSQITTASTNPQEILDVNAWLQANPGLTGTPLTDAAEKQGFDPAFIALVSFPTVVATMAEHIDDYAAIGQVFSADQDAVTASIQRLRAQAYDAGALRTTEQQKVEVQQSAGQTVYVIRPASPTVVYVPQYDPTVVYVRPAPGAVVATSMITFGMGIGIGALIVDNRPWGWGGWGWNWGARRAYYNHRYWNGWVNPYRPPHYWYHSRPIVWANRPGYRGNWGYRPPHYRPPSRPVPKPGRPGNPPGRHHPSPGKPTTPGNPTTPGKPGIPGRPGNPNSGEPTPGRPSGGPGQPATPNKPDQDQPKPGQPTAPGGNKPARPDQPSGLPGKPSAPQQPGSNQPGSNPAKPGWSSGGNRPTHPNQPSGQPGKRQQPTPNQPSSNRPKLGRPGAPGGNKPSPPSGQPSKPATPRQPSTEQPKPNGAAWRGWGNSVSSNSFARQG
jgi:hypothetical protein